jgi:hypothetical protein
MTDAILPALFSRILPDQLAVSLHYQKFVEERKYFLFLLDLLFSVLSVNRSTLSDLALKALGDQLKSPQVNIRFANFLIPAE